MPPPPLLPPPPLSPPSVAAVKATAAAAARSAAPSASVSQRGTAHTMADTYGVWRVSLTPGGGEPPPASRAAALALLQRLAAHAHALCVERKWKVELLRGVWDGFTAAEIGAIARSGIDEPTRGGRLLGLHSSRERRGTALEIALLIGTGDTLWNYRSALGTLEHELAHFEHHDHDAEFYVVESEVRGALAAIPHDNFTPTHAVVWRRDLAADGVAGDAPELVSWNARADGLAVVAILAIVIGFLLKRAAAWAGIAMPW